MADTEAVELDAAWLRALAEASLIICPRLTDSDRERLNGIADRLTRTPPIDVEAVARAICTLNDGGYCDCVGESLGCKVGRGEAPDVSRCKMTAEALPLTAEYIMAKAAIAAMRACKEG